MLSKYQKYFNSGENNFKSLFYYTVFTHSKVYIYTIRESNLFVFRYENTLTIRVDSDLSFVCVHASCVAVAQSLWYSYELYNLKGQGKLPDANRNMS